MVSLSIGLVIHASRRGVFEEAADLVSGVSLKWVTYESEQEIPPRVRNLISRHSLDGLLVGAMPYRACRDLLPRRLPVAITRSSSLDLALVFSQAQALGWEPVPVSIDTFDHEVVAEVTEAMRLDRTRVSCLPYADDLDVADICAFHRRKAVLLSLSSRLTASSSNGSFKSAKRAILILLFRRAVSPHLAGKRW